MSVDEEVGKNLLSQIMGLWIQPEVDKRILEGKLPKNFDSEKDLKKAQVIMNPFVELDRIRLNGEVNGLLIGRYKGSDRKLGEPVMENEVEDILDFKSTKEVNDVSRHATIIQLKGDWWIFFDFREKGQENLKKAKECLQTAQDFYSAADILSEQAIYRPAVDSLYSATELAISAQLWISTSQRFLDEKKKKYTTIARCIRGTSKGPIFLNSTTTFTT